MDESKNLISSWIPPPPSIVAPPIDSLTELNKSEAFSPLPADVIVDLAAPLPDIPALSLPEQVSQFPLLGIDEDSSREDESDEETELSCGQDANFQNIDINEGIDSPTVVSPDTSPLPTTASHIPSPPSSSTPPPPQPPPPPPSLALPPPSLPPLPPALPPPPSPAIPPPLPPPPQSSQRRQSEGPSQPRKRMSVQQNQSLVPRSPLLSPPQEPPLPPPPSETLPHHIPTDVPPIPPRSSRQLSPQALPTDDSPEPYETPSEVIQPLPSQFSAPPTSSTSIPAPFETPSQVLDPHLAPPPQSSDATDTNDLYEEMSPEHEQTTYEEMTSPTIEDVYDDIPGQALHNNEPYVEIMQSGNVQMTRSTIPVHDPFFDDVRSNGDRRSMAPLLGTGRRQDSGAPPQLTAFRGLSRDGFTEEAPPSYDALFGGGPTSFNNIDSVPPTIGYIPPRTSMIHQPTPQIVTRPPAPVVQVQQQQQQISSNTHALVEDDSNCCVVTMNKSPLKTGLYLFLFLIGVLVTLAMLGLGLGLYLTVSPMGAEHTISIYFIVMGSFSAFFVCWHTTALIAGAYIKHNNVPRRDTASSCCMRMCHFGVLFWGAALGYLSFLIWTTQLNEELITMRYVLYGFVVFQYIMLVYCLLEAFIDCCLCFNRVNEELE